MNNITWTYAGEIADPEQAPITRGVDECSECGALVASSGQDVHARWHDNVGIWTVR